jgi:hypothetical protein
MPEEIVMARIKLVCAAVTIVSVLLGTCPDANAGDGNATVAGCLPGPASTWYIGHRTREEVPGPRDRTDIGGGEMVDCRIENWQAGDRMGDVVWEASGGGSVWPLTGPSTVLTADVLEAAGTVAVRATVNGSETKGIDNPAVRTPVFGDSAPTARSETKHDLSSALRALDGLRRGSNTPFDQVERSAGELLRKHPDPKDQGQIYYELAHIYAQSGLVRPQSAIDCVKKAMQCPLTPQQQIRLYGYWGSALLMLKRTDPLPERRRAATIVFLDGLRQLCKLDLPEKPPEIALTVLGGPEPATEADVKEAEQRNQRYVAALERTRFLQEMIQYREGLASQIVWLYSREPHAARELRELVINATNDPKLADRLLQRVTQ